MAQDIAYYRAEIKKAKHLLWGAFSGFLASLAFVVIRSQIVETNGRDLDAALLILGMVGSLCLVFALIAVCIWAANRGHLWHMYAEKDATAVKSVKAEIKNMWITAAAVLVLAALIYVVWAWPITAKIASTIFLAVFIITGGACIKDSWQDLQKSRRQLPAN